MNKGNQEYKSFEIDGVTIEMSMTEYHHFINRASTSHDLF